MDTITHALAGATIGYAVKDRYGWTGTGAVIAGSLAPDLDNFIRLLGSVTYLEYHRVISNSIVGAVVLSLLVALAARRLGHGVGFRTLLALSFTGVAMHVFMDLTNSYGCKLLWPFVDRWYALDMVFILDPWLTGIFALTLVVMRFGADRTGALAGCFMLAAMYWGVRYYEHGRAVEAFKQARPEAVRVGAFPAPLSPFAWHMVAEETDWFYLGWYDLNSGGWDETESIAKEMDSEAVKAALDTRAAKALMSFARFPHISSEEKDGGWLVKIEDLRFSYKRGDSRFVVTVKVDKDGDVEESGFRF